MRGVAADFGDDGIVTSGEACRNGQVDLAQARTRQASEGHDCGNSAYSDGNGIAGGIRPSENKAGGNRWSGGTEARAVEFNDVAGRGRGDGRITGFRVAGSINNGSIGRAHRTNVHRTES